MAIIIQTGTPAMATQSGGQTDNKEEKMMATYTKKLTIEVGKSLRGELAKANIYYDAKIDFATLGTKGSHERWLDSVRVNESTASMYRLIHVSEFIHADQYADQLPADYTKLYQLARIEKAKGTGKKAEKMFLDALDYIQAPVGTPVKQLVADEKTLDRFATTSDLHAFVNRLLDKPEPAKTSAEKGRYKGAGPQEARTLVRLGTSTTGVNLAAAGVSPAGEDEPVEVPQTEEPSLEAIQEELSREFQGDDNDVQFGEFVLEQNEAFNQALRQLQIKKRLYQFMRQEGMKHITVTVSDKRAAAQS